MALRVKVVSAKGLVLAVALLLLGFGSKAQAGCGDHVELGGIVAQTGHAPVSFPDRPCLGPQCSKKSKDLPAVPLEGHKRLVEKSDLVAFLEWADRDEATLLFLSDFVFMAFPGHPTGIFHPPRS